MTGRLVLTCGFLISMTWHHGTDRNIPFFPSHITKRIFGRGVTVGCGLSCYQMQIAVISQLSSPANATGISCQFSPLAMMQVVPEVLVIITVHVPCGDMKISMTVLAFTTPRTRRTSLNFVVRDLATTSWEAQGMATWAMPEADNVTVAMPKTNVPVMKGFNNMFMFMFISNRRFLNALRLPALHCASCRWLCVVFVASPVHLVVGQVGQKTVMHLTRRIIFLWRITSTFRRVAMLSCRIWRETFTKCFASVRPAIKTK
jgi:hypothetical protein